MSIDLTTPELEDLEYLKYKMNAAFKNADKFEEFFKNNGWKYLDEEIFAEQLQCIRPHWYKGPFIYVPKQDKIYYTQGQNKQISKNVNNDLNFLINFYNVLK